MTLVRPRRKATIDKSYKESIDDFNFDDQEQQATSRSNSTKKAGATKKGETTDRKSPPSGKANGNGNGNGNKHKDVNGNGNDTSNGKLKSLPSNWQPPPQPIDYFSNKLDLTDSYISLKKQTLYCPNQPLIPMTYSPPKRKKSKEEFQLKKGDYIYMISEPPGEPYYIGRILGFASTSDNNGSNSSDNDQEFISSKDFRFRIQWFYRPRDISKSTSDSRLLYASMHSDTCPLFSFRGLVTVRHKQDIEDEYLEHLNSIKSTEGLKVSSKVSNKNSNNGSIALEIYSEQPNAFYFDKLFDRYMIKFYDIISTRNLLQYTNVEGTKSKNFLIALNKRFEFIFVESQRLTTFIDGFRTNSRNCDICEQWCSIQDSVVCALCGKFFHMLCLDPPMMKKPSRGFSWSCPSCTKKHEREYEKKHTLMLSHDNKSSNAKELAANLDTHALGEMSDDSDTEIKSKELSLPKYELMAIDFLANDSHLTLEDRRLIEEWSMRYLGLHARLEDGVDVEDRSPFPRASTRLGAKHQATNIPEMFDHPLVYYDEDKSKNTSVKKKVPNKKPLKPKTKDDRDNVKLKIPDEYKDTNINDYPVWLQPRPKGYIQRGEDDGEGVTCTLMWKTPGLDEADNFKELDNYISKCAPFAEKLNMLPTSPNFMDAILKAYLDHSRNVPEALGTVSKLTKKSLREPNFNKEEVKRFEEAVRIYGSELHPVYKEVKTQSSAMVVRFYYLWKKTPNGKLIWGNYEGRAHKKIQNIVKEEQSSSKEERKTNLNEIDYLAHPEDDSSYESNKIVENKKIFYCKHCHTHQSTRWFRLTGFDATNSHDVNGARHKGSGKEDITGLCFRCSRLWRRYAIVWEDPLEVEKKTSKSTSGWKRKVEYELLRDAELILNEAESTGAYLSTDLDNDVDSSISSVLKGKRATASKASTSSVLTSDKISADRNPEEYKNDKTQSSKTAKHPNKKNKATLVKLDENATENNKTGKKNEKKLHRGGTANASNKTESPATSVTKDEKKVTKKTPSGIQDKFSKGVPKGNIETSRGATSKKRKRIDVENKNEQHEKEISEENAVVPSRKRKMNNQDGKLMNPLISIDYLLPSLGPKAKIGKKNVPELTATVLNDIVTSFRKRQLTDLTSQIHSMQIPHLSLALPFDVHDRKCCSCREHEHSNEHESEMLICSHCGVNVHASCVGLTIPDLISKPVKSWLCEACVNDLKPHHSMVYSCCLCLAKESNYELSILGSPLVRPDYLKPVYDSGKWCHLLCAIFNYLAVDLKLVPNVSWMARKFLRDEGTEGKIVKESLSNSISIESVSRVFLNNFDSQCGICQSYNGSLIKCDYCNDNMKYHVTCAQDTPNFKLGFKLDSDRVKDTRIVNVDGRYGKLVPILVCPKHDQSVQTVYNFRKLGFRSYGSKEEKKPLVALFLEDFARSNISRLTGPQLKSSNYIDNCLKWEANMKNTTATSAQYIKLLNLEQSVVVEKLEEKKCCARCYTFSSPLWWSAATKSSNISSGGYLCQSCYHLSQLPEEDKEIEVYEPGQEMLEVLNEPLNGQAYGVDNPEEKLSKSYTPHLNKPEPQTLSEARSLISIHDILS